jgi:putative addiction module component (TIGR02574 family)
MSPIFAEIESQARNLSSDERARLAELLLESIHEGENLQFKAVWSNELKNRVAAYERGEAQLYLAEEVFTEAKYLAQ